MRLASVLGGLPLALDQAGGYIERKQCSFERYLHLYEQAHEKLLAQHGLPDDITDYKYTVATTWSLSFQQIAQWKHGQVATDLLRLCAFLAPDDIPMSLFDRDVSEAVEIFGLDLSQVSIDPLLLEDVLEALLKYSLIRREGDALFIHRLVQTVLRDAMTEEERLLWAERAIQLMNIIFPDPQKVEYWQTCQYLLPHMLACAAWIEQLSIKIEESALLLSFAAYYLKVQGLYREAEPLYEESLKIYRAVLGEPHPDTAGA